MAKKTIFSALFFLLASVGYVAADTVADTAHAGHDAVEHAEHGHDDAAHGEHGEHDAHEGGVHKLPLHPEGALHDDKSHPLGILTNSMISVWIAVLIIVLFCRAAAGKLSMIPQGFQNFAEWLIESLYNFFGGILGEHLVKRTFWFFGSTFLLIILVNYLGLLPGVGTIVRFREDGSFAPMLRGGNADVNMTAAMAFTFAILWFYWAITENGFKGFMAHIFAPKGKFGGLMMVMMLLIFGLVGVLEVVSIGIRPVALTFRLFGNIYGGEQTLEILMGLGGDYLAFLPALPFYFMELLVGGVQALVFTLLSAVFLKLICEHSDHDHDEEHAEAH
ncbi:F-type H+-transporting ATPase subunit a [Rubritalea squalenifaciens DSM 18772]|uniref:ATP synthase subunit a n=1 Tax=Rubritalea squalenifaciens DSM 18772 TaxID=1123071 RepID=A0A1M6DLV0_9BACT|nr:F0F1 ATP synthase subunit A [Rubritalea squalenifaciens]SHI74111.1 F-type H+-transporting ATPase subunit a [Rubritalea squalenifaciens DSM 18772]